MTKLRDYVVIGNYETAALVLGSPGRVVRQLSREEQTGIRGWALKYVEVVKRYRFSAGGALAHARAARASARCRYDQGASRAG